MSKQLFIRVDASVRIGTGHVMRCLAVAQAWTNAPLNPANTSEYIQRKEPFLPPDKQATSPAVVFICSKISQNLAERIAAAGFSLVNISAKEGSAKDLAQTIKIVSTCCTSTAQCPAPLQWVIVDGYHFDHSYQHGIRASGYKLLVIDDYNHLPKYECDILVNQNINASQLQYHLNPEAKQLIGTEFALLRREFITSGHKTSNDQKRKVNILVTMGGSDPDNVTAEIILALQQIQTVDCHIKVLIGPANPHSQALKQTAAASNLDIELLHQVLDMPELLKWADLTLSAAGSTCWELCCLKIPFGTVILAENQKALALELEKCGIAPCLKIAPDKDIFLDKLHSLITNPQYRSRLKNKIGNLVDGFGAIRVLTLPAKNAKIDLVEKLLSLRSALPEDTELIWRWANEKNVRENSYSHKPIALSEHQEWFTKKLASSNTLMFILELGNIPAGLIRYDRSESTATIGFSIDPRFRGLGLGQKIISQTTTLAFEKLHVTVLKAEVFKGNHASNAIFKQNGFTQSKLCDIKGIPSYVYLKEKK